MKASSYLKIIALILSFLIVSIPVLAAEENRFYDANGNLISGDGYYREYNELNQLVRIRQGNLSSSPILEEYIWHPIEERILVKDIFSNGVLNYSIYYVNKNYIHIENSSGNYTEKYIYQDNALVAFVDTDGDKKFVHNDHESSVNLVTDINGNVVENTLYSAYGEILSGGTASRYDYEGKEFDSLTNRLDFHFRQIDPRIPVWDKPDTLIQNVYDPQSLNRYAFERNNPYRYEDKDGHIIKDLIKLVIVYTVLYLYFYGKVIEPEQKKIEQFKYAQVEQNDAKNQKQTEIPPATAQDVLTISDNAAKSMEVNTKEKVSDTTQYKIIEKSELSEEDLKRIKKPLGTIEPPPIKIEIVKDKDKAKVSSSGSGGKGGSDFVPDPSGRKDRFGNPVYVPKSEIRRRR